MFIRAKVSNIEFPFVVVNTVYSGASPEVIETDITRKIEDQVNTIAGVKEDRKSVV